MTPKSAYLIGLTGGIASGKSALARALRAQGAAVIDADAISRQLTASGGSALKPLRETFGDGVFSGAELNRAALAAQVFADAEELQKLNALMHPMILAEVERLRTEMAASKVIVLDAALLYEAGWDSRCDEVWCAWLPRCLQLRRVMRRDQLSFRQANERLNSQLPTSVKRRRADHSILTLGSREKNGEKAIRLWRDALRRAELA